MSGPHGLRLRRCVRLDFGDEPLSGTQAPGGEGDRAAARTLYHRDLLRPHGLETGLDTAALKTPGPSYGEMGRTLLEAAVSPDEPVDLLVLAYAVPDLEPGRATATYLSHLCPGRPMAFAISDQGTAAAFTGLKLIGEYARSGDTRRAVLLILEQPTLPYDPGVPVTLPAAAAGVALVLEAPESHVRADADADMDTDVDAAELTLRLTSVSVEPGVAEPEPPRASDGTSVLLGAGFTPDETRPYTGVWWQLLGLLSTRDDVLLADFEPVSQSVCLAEFRART
ncbi:hypothetical protein KDL01_19850 [Actinospica durhamensis]|uniref:2-hydroxy-acid oxidase n=1 Tax=Actinospica durhamensis TaxID=1508375 RepID=A0A941EQI4_9ACTN|nr:hypothetical protein [Actinospica durhamensis]MBR7835540.1 hypothetical protein [Actinospica durhamensis]